MDMDPSKMITSAFKKLAAGSAKVLLPNYWKASRRCDTMTKMTDRKEGLVTQRTRLQKLIRRHNIVGLDGLEFNPRAIVTASVSDGNGNLVV